MSEASPVHHRQSRRRRPGGAPEPPGAIRRATAPPPPPQPPPRSSMPPRSDRQQPAGEHEERRIVENGEDGLLKQARHLGLDVGDNARRPRSSLQQRVERRAAVSGLQVQTGSCGHRHPHIPGRCPQGPTCCTSSPLAADAGEDGLPPTSRRLSATPSSALPSS